FKGFAKNAIYTDYFTASPPAAFCFKPRLRESIVPSIDPITSIYPVALFPRSLAAKVIPRGLMRAVL
ncbi:hypothetical protein, partial [Sodalis sp.]|uniref:hypothetical protein n=1 Tax=Sodalis sp. (in: enterobacteria) TaxID=1898979 RepID=UPI0038739F5C